MLIKERQAATDDNNIATKCTCPTTTKLQKDNQTCSENLNDIKSHIN